MPLSVARRLKALAEETLGVRISRTRPPAAHKHADDAIRTIRHWSPEDVVLDVGANDGRTVLRLHPQLGGARVFAFEPVAATYQTLVARTSHLPNVRTFPLAIGAARGQGTIHLNDIDSMNSLSAEWTASPSGVEAVDITTIDAFMAEQQIDFVHLLKIDTEGHELPVLQGARGVLSSSRVALIQVEAGFDQMPGRAFAPLEAVRQYLAPLGYVLYGIYNQCRSPARSPTIWTAVQRDSYAPKALVYCDALFLRTDLGREPKDP